MVMKGGEREEEEAGVRGQTRRRACLRLSAKRYSLKNLKRPQRDRRKEMCGGHGGDAWIKKKEIKRGESRKLSEHPAVMWCIVVGFAHTDHVFSATALTRALANATIMGFVSKALCQTESDMLRQCRERVHGVFYGSLWSMVAWQGFCLCFRFLYLVCTCRFLVHVKGKYN